MALDTEGFTAVVCRRCTAAGSDFSVLDALRETVRRAPNGVLVSTGCLLDEISCVGRTDGVMVLVQPCSADREPTSCAVMFGPIDGAESAVELRNWLESGLP